MPIQIIKRNVIIYSGVWPKFQGWYCDCSKNGCNASNCNWWPRGKCTHVLKHTQMPTSLCNSRKVWHDSRKKEKEENSYTKNSSKLISHTSGCEGEKMLNWWRETSLAWGQFILKNPLWKRESHLLVCVFKIMIINLDTSLIHSWAQECSVLSIRTSISQNPPKCAFQTGSIHHRAVCVVSEWEMNDLEWFSCNKMTLLKSLHVTFSL